MTCTDILIVLGSSITGLIGYHIIAALTNRWHGRYRVVRRTEFGKPPHWVVQHSWIDPIYDVDAPPMRCWGDILKPFKSEHEAVAAADAKYWSEKNHGHSAKVVRQ